jgi:hypothetical protein
LWRSKKPSPKLARVLEVKDHPRNYKRIAQGCVGRRYDDDDDVLLGSFYRCRCERVRAAFDVQSWELMWWG